MAVPRGSLPLVCVYLSAVLIGQTWCNEPACLQDGRHKATPSPEPHLPECQLYSDNSCCSEEHVQDLVAPSSRSPSWDKCGALSTTCEGFLKRVACFYRCSPDAAHWPHPHHHTTLHAVPLCHSFCRDWYEACRTEMTCARNWASDPRGRNCTGSCVTYQQMYQHGRDLCESLWGEAFMTVEDEEEEEEEGGRGGRGGGGEGGEVARPCGCLTLSPSDREVIAALHALEAGSEELDTTKSDLPHYRAPCARPRPRPARASPAPPPSSPVARGNAALRKRSLLADDGEGSGSGM